MQGEGAGVARWHADAGDVLMESYECHIFLSIFLAVLASRWELTAIGVGGARHVKNRRMDAVEKGICWRDGCLVQR